jgi:hypothetical protein
MNWVSQIEGAREVDIETRRGADAPVHRTTIWAVVDGEDVFVRSWRGAGARWYRELTANPVAVLHAEGGSTPVSAVAASDPDSVARVSAGYRRKYGDSSVVDSMVRDEILDTTVRLEPARS